MQFIDLKAQYAALKTEIDANIHDVLDNAAFIGGKYVEELETELAKYVCRKHCITCANGTDALQLAFMMLGVGQGDAVFTTDITFVASTEPAKMLGATPVFCDVDPRTYNMDPASLEKQLRAVISEGKLIPKAVVAVDIYGNPADYDAIGAVCERYGLPLIEDAAQAFGAEYKGRKACSFGAVATTSFFPAKPLGCYGDGGAVFVDDDRLAAVCRQLCVHGKGPRGKYDNVIVGLNSRLDNIQAAVLLPKLKALREYEMRARQTVAKRYNDAFSGKLQTPYVQNHCSSAYAQYVVLAKNTEERDRIIAHLKDKGVPSMVYYPTAQHELPVFAEEPHYGELYNNALTYCARTFSLPMHPYLDEQTQQLIIDAVLEAL